MSWLDELKYDPQGLVPVVAQQCTTGEVLMVAYADRDALERTLATGRAHYWSRSRGELWEKGATSGHVQEVEEVRVDCDADVVLYRVRQRGPACHTLAPSCFFRRVGEDGSLEGVAEAGHIMDRLDAIVARRDAERPEGSYTTYLFEKGLDKVLKKLGEESTEVIIAAKNADAAEVAAEAADLLFHLLVTLRSASVPLEEVWSVLESRFGQAPRRPSNRRTDHPHS